LPSPSIKRKGENGVKTRIDEGQGDAVDVWKTTDSMQKCVLDVVGVVELITVNILRLTVNQSDVRNDGYRRILCNSLAVVNLHLQFAMTAALSFVHHSLVSVGLLGLLSAKNVPVFYHGRSLGACRPLGFIKTFTNTR
jgi:hypothetical protein